MIDYTNYEKIGYSDYGDIYIKRMGDKIVLKRITPLDYDYMRNYIDENADLLSEWQDDVYHWNTELGYEEWRDNYEYDYSEYFQHDSETDDYYDENETGTTWDYFYTDRARKELTIENAMECFDDEYSTWNFEWADMNEQQLREKIGQYYDECIQYRNEIEERRKPHWNAFKYYKE